jgi:hypothetical protein
LFISKEVEAYQAMYVHADLAGWLKVSKLMYGLGVNDSNILKCLASIGDILSSRPSGVEPEVYMKQQEERVFKLLDTIGAADEK